MSRLAVAVLAVCLVLGPVAPVVAQDGATGTGTTNATATAEPTPELGACTGTMTDPADGITVVSVQGARFRPEVKKTTARLVAFGPRGNVRWVHEPEGVVWSYDIDPLPDGDLFLTATTRVEGEGKTKFVRFDPENQSAVWSVTADFHDTHDADLLDEHRIAVANMRDPDPANGTNGDSLAIFNRTSGEVEWEWHFDDHYPPSVGGNYSDDWTHVNDIDPVRGGEAFLASPRNLDQVILVDRSSGEIEARLGRDQQWSTLHAQHNPMYLESDSGRPTFLVADSENDRLVEYELREGANATAGTAGEGGAWRRTWTLGSAESFQWPRDADRLENGNTLVGDSRHNRVLEVTPEGEVVWEVYAPWLVYDVARVSNGNEDGGPTIADQGAAGTYNLSGDTAFSLDQQEACASTLDAAAGRGSFFAPGGAVDGVVQRLGGLPVVVGGVVVLVVAGVAFRFRDRLV
ncbi:aryl-sulfate sulfotransferase [Haloglomus salinum]|uniref:aryl-sulfate sulfotransferase n=1 Tax=Haloglomus salinum TaxID=2962673 RepID=UPI0020C9784D|nr:aryl-sulfate sulfotransferase [Haloglomus salinum]